MGKLKCTKCWMEKWHTIEFLGIVCSTIVCCCGRVGRRCYFGSLGISEGLGYIDQRVSWWPTLHCSHHRALYLVVFTVLLITVAYAVPKPIGNNCSFGWDLNISLQLAQKRRMFDSKSIMRRTTNNNLLWQISPRTGFHGNITGNIVSGG